MFKDTRVLWSWGHVLSLMTCFTRSSHATRSCCLQSRIELVVMFEERYVRSLTKRSPRSSKTWSSSVIWMPSTMSRTLQSSMTCPTSTTTSRPLPTVMMCSLFTRPHWTPLTRVLPLMTTLRKWTMPVHHERLRLSLSITHGWNTTSQDTCSQTRPVQYA